MPAGLIVGIVIGGLLLLTGIGVGGFFGIRALVGQGRDATTETPAQPASSPEQAASAPAAPTDSADANTTQSEDTATDEVITDAQARETVEGFLDARLRKDVEGSREFFSNNYWNGEDHDMLTDVYWRPERYEIVNSQADLMYVHVVVLTNWPSGDEYMIWSCVKDPTTGKPLIDGKLDPQYVPEMIPK